MLSNNTIPNGVNGVCLNMRFIYPWAFIVNLACFDAACRHHRSLQDKEELVRSVQRGFGAQIPLGANTQHEKANARTSSEPLYQASLAIHGAGGFSGWEYRTMSTRPQTNEKADDRRPAVQKGEIRPDVIVDDSLQSETTPLTAFYAPVAPVERTDAKAIWRQLQSDFALHQPAGSIDSVIQDSWVIAYEDGEFIIGIADAFRLDWVEKSCAIRSSAAWR